MEWIVRVQLQSAALPALRLLAQTVAPQGISASRKLTHYLAIAERIDAHSLTEARNSGSQQVGLVRFRYNIEWVRNWNPSMATQDACCDRKRD